MVERKQRQREREREKFNTPILSKIIHMKKSASRNVKAKHYDL
jgi:hypothetical protein